MTLAGTTSPCGPGKITMKGYSIFPKSQGLDIHHEMMLVYSTATADQADIKEIERERKREGGERERLVAKTEIDR